MAVDYRPSMKAIWTANAGTTVWPIWSSTTTCAAIADPWPIWTSVNSTATATTLTVSYWPHWVETAERKRARAEMQRQQAERLKAEAALAAVARSRAVRLRDRYLTPAQREQLAQHGYFDLAVGSGRIYRIHGGTHGNVREMVRQPDGSLRAVASLCCQPNGLPEADAHVAQLLWLTHDEEQFRRTANIRGYDPYPHRAPGRAADLEPAAA